MSQYVVDASVVVKWFLPEIYSESALRLLEGGHSLLVPDLLFAEVGNTLWKRTRRGEITPEQGLHILQVLDSLPLKRFSMQLLVAPAYEIAQREGCTLYDSLYLALALREGISVVTADAKLYNALRASPLSSCLCWVENVP